MLSDANVMTSSYPKERNLALTTDVSAISEIKTENVTFYLSSNLPWLR